MISRLSVVRLVVLLTAPLTLLHAEDRKSPEAKVTEHRRHFAIHAKDGTTVYEATDLVRLGDLMEENLVLVRDGDHGDFLLRRRWDFRSQIVQWRIADVKDRGFIQVSYQTPYTSRTRLDTLAEARRHSSLSLVKIPLTLETNGGTWEGSESEWIDDPIRLRALRYSVRSTLDRFVLEAIERGRGSLFSSVEGEPFFDQVGRYAVYESGEAKEAAAVIDAKTVTPDCDFDEAFGYPCTARQKERVLKAVKDGQTPGLY